MKRIFTTTFLFLILSFTFMKGQELKVISFSLVPEDQTAVTQRRDDFNGVACALIKVQLKQSGATFRGNVMGETSFSQDEYLVFMSKGSKMLQVKLDGYLPLEIRFAEFGITSLESLSTYRLKLMLPKEDDSAAQVGQLDVNYEPHGAEVWIDGEMKGTSPYLFKDLKMGSHQVEIRKEGYQNKIEMVVIAEGQTLSLSGSLLSAAASSEDLKAVNKDSSSSQSCEIYTVNGISFKMIRVEGGTFMMGATSEQGSEANDYEKPVHQVTLSSYYIAETEVTQELWEAVMGSNPSGIRGGKRPVERVSWNDCQEFVRKLNMITGRNFSLPTEAQWEYAARGGKLSKGFKFAGDYDIESVAWYSDNCLGETHDVATKQPNELGVYDMTGNVWEWCYDWYGNYSSDSQTDPHGPQSGRAHIIRGGSWGFLPKDCRVTKRAGHFPEQKELLVGLRLVLND